MNGRGPKLYALLARLAWPKSYLGKLMLITFLGIHVPLIAFVLYLVFAASTDSRASLSVLVIVLVATLFGTVLTLCALYALLCDGGPPNGCLQPQGWRATAGQRPSLGLSRRRQFNPRGS